MINMVTIGRDFGRDDIFHPVQKIVVTPKTIIATTVPGTKADLKPGLKVFVAGAPKLPDGSLDVAAIQVEKEIPPPQ